MKAKINTQQWLVPIILVLIGVMYLATPGANITGMTILDISSDYENSMTLTATPEEKIIIQTLTFGEYRPEICTQGISVYASDGTEVDFDTQNDVYEDGLCLGTKVMFYNLIYEPPSDTTPEEPTIEPELPVEEPLVEPEPVEEEPVPEPEPTEEVPTEEPVIEEEPVVEEEPTPEPEPEPTSGGADEVSEGSSSEGTAQSEPTYEVPAETITGAVSRLPEADQIEYTIYYGLISEPEPEIEEEPPTEEPPVEAETPPEPEVNGTSPDEVVFQIPINETDETPLTNDTIEPVNDTVINDTINDTLFNETLNETLLNETINETNNTVRVRTIQLGAKIFEPVKWEMTVEPQEPVTEVTVDLPQKATMVEVKKVEPPEFGISAEDAPKQPAQYSLSEQALIKYVTVNEDLTAEDSLVIEYETPAPITTEEMVGDTKRVVVSSDMHYENVLTYTTLENPVPEQAIHLYWLKEDERVDVTDDPDVDLWMIDNDADGLIDYLEWITPHTSNQTFEIDIIILNPYTYLRDGENWTVAFNTTGTADLKISSPNANWTEVQNDSNETFDEMTFLSLYCGEESVENEIQVLDPQNSSFDYSAISESQSVKPYAFLVQNYSCNDTAYFKNLMNKAGYATLRFDFSNYNITVTDFAYDPPDQNCSLTANYTQTDHNDSCDNLYTNGYLWNSDGYNLTVANDVIINGTGGILDAGDASNITLGSLTIASGNTYNATSGTTTIDGTSSGVTIVDIDGTFTHNEGKFVIDGMNAVKIVNTGGATFYDFTMENIVSGQTLLLYENMNVINVFEIDEEAGFYGNDQVLTLGNASQSGNLTTTDGNFFFNTGKRGYIYGASADYPAIIENGVIRFDWKNNGNYHLKWVDLQADIVTDEAGYGSGATIIIDGDCEFDALTVSSGDTFNVSDTGQANFTGDLIYDGNFTLDGNITGVYDSLLNVTDELVVNSMLNASNSSSTKVGSLTINSGGTYSATSGTTTITSESSGGFTIENAGTFTHNNGLVNVTGNTGSASNLDIGSSSLYDLEFAINGETLYFTVNNMTIEDNLTINDGTVNPYNVDLDVTGDVVVTGTLDANTDGNGAVTLGTLTINSGGTYSATSGTTTIDGTTGGAGATLLNIDGTFTHNDGDFVIDGMDAVKTIHTGGAAFYNFTMSNIVSGQTLVIAENMNVTNVFEIDEEVGLYDIGLVLTLGNGSQSGTMKTTDGNFFVNVRDEGYIYGASPDYPAIIDGDVFNWDWKGDNIYHLKWVDYQSDTNTHKSGNDDNITIIIDGDSEFDALTVSSGDTFSITDTGQANFSSDFVYNGNFTLDGNITNISSINVTENVVINGLLNASQSTQADFGSLTINSGGTYDATSGTTTLTSESGSGFAYYKNGGTLTHNDGIFNVTTSTVTVLYDASGSGNMYDLVIDTSTDNTILWRKNGYPIDNNLTISSGSFGAFDANDDLTVTGDVVVDGGTLLGANSEMSFGSLTINSGGNYSATSGTTTINGGLLDYGTYTTNNGVVNFAGASGSVNASTDLYNVTVSGNVTFNADVNYTNYLNITSTGNLTFNATNEDNGTYYYKATGGYASITGSSTLTSQKSYFEDSQLVSNSPGASNLIDAIEAGSTWTVTGWDSIAPIITLNKPDEGYNSSSQDMTFNFTAIENMPETVNCSLYIDGTHETENATTANNTLTNLEATGVSEGSHTWNITCIDTTSNTNSSENRNFTVDATPPNVTNVVYSPNTSASLDPNVDVLFNATIADNLFDIDTVILQYHNGTGWANSTMTNSSAADYNTTITLISTQTNYTFNIFANDSVNNINQTSNQTFESLWDCTWTTDSDLGTIAGWDENKWIGNISVNNTGDLNHGNNNCSLDVRLTYDLPEGRIYYKLADNDWEYVKNLGYTVVSAGNNMTIQLNATFLSETQEESLVITLDEFRARSADRYNNITASLVTNQQGPYLLQEITSPGADVLYLTAQDLNLSARVRNIMGSIPENETNTAYNITVNWTLPSGFTTSDNTAINYTNISNSTWVSNEVNTTFSDLTSMNSGTQTFILQTQGYNQTGDVILNAQNESVLNDSVTLTFLCYNTSDGVCVEGCGYQQDSDCDEPSSASSGGGGGGGAGGAAGGSGVAITRTYTTFELVRDSNQSFTMYYNNSGNLTIDNLTISVVGFNAKYIRISPPFISNIGPYRVVPIVTHIEAPKYFSRGEHNLTYTLNVQNFVGNTTLSKKEIRYITLLILEISKDGAQKYLTDSQKAIKEMEKANFSTDEVLTMFKQASSYFTDKKYLEVKELGTQIIDTKETAFEVSESIEDIEDQVNIAFYWGLKTPKTRRLLNLAKASFDRGEYSLAEERIEEAGLVIALETKGEVNYVYFIWRNWKQLAIASIITLFAGIFVFLQFKLYLINERLAALEDEETTILGLMKELQKECFVDKKMSMNEYMEAMVHYENKLSKDIQEVVALHSAKTSMFKFDKIHQMQKELAKLTGLLKDTQKQYLEAGKIQTKVYQQKMKSLTKRITEVEEKLTVLEAEVEIRRRTNSTFKFIAYLQKKKIIKLKVPKAKTAKEEIKELKSEEGKDITEAKPKKTTLASKLKFKLPALHLSKFKLPKLSKKKSKAKKKAHKFKLKLPKLKLSKVAIPKVKLPKLAVPKLKLPKTKAKSKKSIKKKSTKKSHKFKFELPTFKLSLPKFKLKTKAKAKRKKVADKKKSKAPAILPKLPKMKLPKLAAPKIKPPKFKRPKFHIKKPEMPKVELPDMHLKKPKLHIPETKFPKINVSKPEVPKLSELLELPDLPKPKLPKVKAPDLHVEESVKEIRKEERMVSKKVRAIKLPKFKLPKLKAPKMKLPKVEPPKLPDIEPPKVEAPKIKVPKVKTPQIKLLKFKKPKLHLKRKSKAVHHHDTPLDQLRAYIKHRLSLKEPTHKIKRTLLDVGWNEFMVIHAFNTLDIIKPAPPRRFSLKHFKLKMIEISKRRRLKESEEK